MRAAWCLLALAACADLHEFAPGTCGNGVVDPGEDCDSFPDPAFGGGTACGTDGDQACHYITSAITRCPFGWDADAEGICRHGGGEFRAAPDVEVKGAVKLGDFDGDHVLDLAVQSNNGFSILYGNGQGAFGDAYVFESLVPDTLAIDDLDGDHRSDVMFDLDGGLAILRGDASRNLHPVEFLAGNLDESSLMFAKLITAHAHGRQFDSLVEYGAPVDGDGFAVTVDAIADAPQPLFPGEEAFELLDTPAIARGNIDVDPAGDGDELLFAFTDSPVVHVVSIVAANDTDPPTLVERAQITLPGSAIQPPVFADFDGDGKVDVIAPYESSSGDTVVSVARGHGDGAFDPAFDAAEFAGTYPVAVADLDGDGFDDFALCNTDASQTELDVSLHHPGRLDPVNQNIFTQFTCPPAVTGDFNRDGKPDIAWITDSGIDVFSPGKTPGFVSLVSIPTPGDPFELHAGDFDGDGTDDLVFYTDVSTSTTPIRIIYGAVDGPLPQPVAVADIPEPRTLTAGLFRSSDHSERTNLFVTTGEGDFYILEGRAERTLVSSLHGLTGQQVSGKFLPDVAGRDVIVEAADQLFLGTFDAIDEKITFPLDESLVLSIDSGKPFANGFLLDVPSPDASVPDALVSVDELGLRVATATIDPALSVLTVDDLPLAGFTNIGVSGQSFVADLDGDGHPELIVATPDALLIVHSIDVVANAGGEPQVSTLAHLNGSQISAVAPIHAGVHGVGLVVATIDHLLLFQQGPTGLLDTPTVIDTVTAGAASLLAGDFNGDGVDDVFFTDILGGHVLLGVRGPDLGGS